MMKHSFAFLLAVSMLGGYPAGAQTSKDDAQRREINPDLRPANEPPRADDNARRPDESSSKDRDIDIAPPTNDAGHPGSTLGGPEPAEGVTEMKPWNPHQADKDVEVGLYYFRQKNYRAAESRFREALYWQDNHAEASYRLATALEKLGKASEARQYYESYLKILPNGDLAKEAKKGLDRLNSLSQSAKKLPAKPTSQP